MSNEDDLIRQFSETTGLQPDRSRFYLESAGWEIGVALETYFDSRGSQDEDVNMEDYHAQQQMPGSGFAPYFTPPTNAAPAPAASQAVPRPIGNPKPTSGASGSSRIATLNSIRGRESTDEEDDDPDNDKDQGQEFYVGSGQEVIGPGRKQNRNPDDIITSVFKSARQHGAEQVEHESPAAGRSSMFTGAGQRLDASAPVGTHSAPIPSGSAPAPVDPPNRGLVVLRMWQNGFTVNDGPLRGYSDPANEEFMSSVKQGRMPRELAMMASQGEVRVQMEDHRDAEYRPPKKAPEYFGGTGHMLGSPAPAVVSNPGTAKKAESGDARKASEDKAKAAFASDGSLPATNIQIRLTDGSRIVHRFNEVATVGDIRRFVRLARPEFEAADFQMLAGFPSKALTDDSVSLKDANLLNAAIQVK
ncbi:NSFL1 cofactor p47-like [Paramacrobiotus metropolitanus]|uniref:NSFL1 cofactor p47-like n=1 Tax=Paramacrobiotus metropolitanus TaxID=2943436 RepID=UPI002445A2F4|nr:NSFL1 cofactor p47-like [Paramacrobiotus metropolitanus]